MAEIYIFDSHALLRFFQKEKGADEVAALLERIRRAGREKYINAINLGEIIYIIKREFGELKKIETLAHIERLGFKVLPVPNSLIFRAAELKAEFSISYADCFLLASALEYNTTVVTGDNEFKKVEHLVKIKWV